MRTTIARRALPATILLVVVAGCSSASTGATSTPAAASAPVATTTTAPAAAASPTDNAPAASGKAADPCHLVTAADASTAMHASVPTATPLPAGQYRQCAYRAGAHSLVVLDRQIDRATFDKSAKLNPGVVTPVSSLGTPAYGSSNGLLVWKNGTEVVIALLPGSTGNLAAEEHLATGAISRL